MDRPLDLARATRNTAAATKPAACERDTINAIHLRIDGYLIKILSHHTVTSYHIVSPVARSMSHDEIEFCLHCPIHVEIADAAHSRGGTRNGPHWPVFDR